MCLYLTINTDFGAKKITEIVSLHFYYSLKVDATLLFCFKKKV